MDWYVYMLRCEDGSLYTGIASDVEKRFATVSYTHLTLPTKLEV